MLYFCLILQLLAIRFALSRLELRSQGVSSENYPFPILFTNHCLHPQYLHNIIVYL